MTLPDWLRQVLPPDTAASWEAIAPIVPDACYLAGGTAISVHLHHRVSRDLDFFYHHNAVDLDALIEALRERGPFAVSNRSPGTLNGLFSATEVQFLHADEGEPQRLLEQPTVVEGLRIAGISDLLAMKLNAIGRRGEARDYFDVMTIETQTGRSVEEGLGLFLARYNVPPDEAVSAIAPVVRALGYLDDIEEDAALPISFDALKRYWQQRQAEVVAHLDRFGAPIPPELAAAPVSLPSASGGRVRVRAYRRADGTAVREHHRG